MMYGNYGNYNEGGYGRGNYNEGGNYGRRGVPGTGRGRRYRGYSGAEEHLNDMHEHYGAYSESREAANSGNYGAEQDSKKALEYIEKKYQEGWYGHYECIVPTTILNNSEFKVDYLNNYNLNAFHCFSP